MDKLVLRKIAKRWCKGIIEANEAMVSFCDSGLNEDEIEYIQEECMKIAERITKDDVPHHVNDLVKEYYDFE